MTRESGQYSSPGITAASFQRLEGRVRQLRRLLLLLLAVIAVVPASVFFVLQIGHSQKHMREYARHFGLLVTHHLQREGAPLASLFPHLQLEMTNNRIIFLQLLDTVGKEILRLGAPRRQLLPLRASATLSPSLFHLSTVTIQQDVRPLLRDSARVFGIHICVAFVLTLVVYGIPMRALRRAISDVQAGHAQAIHADKLRAIGEAYATLTHEINNPLSIILSRVKLILDSGQEQQLPPDLVRDLQVIERHGTRIADTLHSLLPFARKTPFQWVPTDLNQVVTETIALVKAPFALEGIRIEAILPVDLSTCSGSPNHLQQVFLNLLNNARDAMPKGGQITIRTSQTATHVAAEVQDTGTGIPPHLQVQIFEPFFTTKKAGHGTGLGLAVSYGIITDHGGTIEVESEPDKGTTFRLRLPRQAMQS